MTGPRQDPDLIRPYVRTGGRTRPSQDVRLESLVFAATGTVQGLGPDVRRVLSLFAPSQGGGLAVADIAAALALPPSAWTTAASTWATNSCCTCSAPSDKYASGPYGRT